MWFTDGVVVHRCLPLVEAKRKLNPLAMENILAGEMRITRVSYWLVVYDCVRLAEVVSFNCITVYKVRFFLVRISSSMPFAGLS
jgi:hypothetical protein